MPITGHFGADFSDFNTAVAEAEIKLKGFETDATTVEARLNRLGNAFSGQKIIQDATLMVKAINELGGATALTETEQKKVNAVLEEAINKYRALGKEAPQAMRDLAAATAKTDDAMGKYVVTAEEVDAQTKQTGSSTNFLTRTITDLAAGLAGILTVRGAINFVEDAVSSASALANLSAQTRIGVEDLQVMAGAMSEFGIDADTLGRAVFGLSEKIAGSDTSVTNALHTMGLTLEDVAGLNGQELFLKMEHGLASLQGNLRDTTAVDLFGEKLGRAMAGAASGIDGAMEKWRAMNNIISTDTVKALDDMGNAMARAQTNITNMAINALGPLAQGFNTLAGAAEGGASKFSILWATLTDFVLTQQTGQTHTENLTKLLDDQAKKAEATAAATRKNTEAHQAAPPVLDAHGQAMRALAALEADAAKPLLDWQVEYLDKLRELDHLDMEHAKTAQITAEQLKAYTQSVKERTAAEDSAAKASMDLWNIQQKAVQEFDKAQEAVHALTIKRQAEVRAELEKTTAARTKEVNEAITRELEAEGRLAAQWGEATPTALEKYTAAMEKLNRAHIEGIKDTAQRQEVENEFAKSLLDFAVNGEAALVTITGLSAAEREHAQATEEARGGLVAYKNEVNSTREAAEALREVHEKVDQQFGMSSAGGIGIPLLDPNAYYAELERQMNLRGYQGVPSGSPGVVTGGGGGGYHGGFRAGEPRGSTVFNITHPLGTPNQIARAVGQAQTGRLASQGWRAPES